MEHGRRRSSIEYRWPTTLLLPERPPSLIYLDMNHWISLAKAHSGHHTGGPHHSALEACIDSVSRGTAIFPISDSIIFEISKVGRHRQRKDLQEVIERIAEYRVITARNVISTHEVESMLDDLVGPSPNPINNMTYLDWGVARAFGVVGGFGVRDEAGEDVTAEARASFKDGPEAFDMVFMKAELDLQRSVLAGPTPGEEPDLRELGWDPKGGLETENNRVQQELDQVKVFNADPQRRRGRIRDVISAREILIEIYEALDRGALERGIDLVEVLDSPEKTRSVMDAMPSFDVAVSIKTSYHRNPEHHWTTNDISDIDAMGSAIPYCDVVVTDKAVASHLRQSGVADRLDCVVLSKLEELLPLL